MTWITLICCLFALSSSVFGRSHYGSYSSMPLTHDTTMGVMRDMTSQKQPIMSQLPIETGYEKPTLSKTFLPGMTSSVKQDTIVQPVVPTMTSSYDSSYGGETFVRKPTFIQADQTVVTPQRFIESRTFPSPSQLLFEQERKLQEIVQQQTPIATEADMLCRGHRAETVIPLDNNRRFVVCLDDGKGYQQECPKGLYYHPDSRRCERTLGPLENPCASQPCMNGGQCIVTDVSSYKCQCAAGFDGKMCELDATVCQTQQPCGQSPDTRCQSFRLGAALQYICILQDARGYGLSVQQGHSSPCRGVDGTYPLAFSNKGFIMCDGEYMFIESCPGGTIWDDMNKACVWPDMQGFITTKFSDLSLKTPIIESITSSYSSLERPKTVEFEQFKTMPISYEQTPMKTYGYTVQKPMPILPQADLSKTTFVEEMKLPEKSLPIRVLPQSELISTPTYQYSTPTYETRPMMKPQVWEQPIQRQEDMRFMQRTTY